MPKVDSVEAQYENFQNNNLYSNTYNPGLKDHPNFKWNNKHTLNANQGVQWVPQSPPKKPSPLEEALTGFMKASQTSFELSGKTRRNI